MDRTLHRIRWAGVFPLAALVATATAQESATREIGRTTEKELKVVLSSSFGTLVISKGEPEKIAIVESGDDQSAAPPASVDYSIRNRIGYMDVTLGKKNDEDEKGKRSFSLSNFDRGKWYLRFTDAVPISFDVQLGVGRGDFNFTGLQIKDFNLSTSASDVTLAFDEMNRSSIENVSIESGVSKFDGRNLCNANFKHFKFQGGVGAYTLDFGGKLNTEVDVDLEVGLGVMTIYIPSDVGAKVFYEKSWVSRLDVDRDFHSTSDNQYTSDNFNDATGRMNIRIDSGLGSIKVRRR
jgi:hypothetical protein